MEKYIALTNILNKSGFYFARGNVAIYCEDTLIAKKGAMKENDYVFIKTHFIRVICNNSPWYLVEK